MIVYISGAITNDPNYKDKFAKAEKYLTDKGHEVINPAKIAESLPELEHEQYIHIDKALIDICDAVYFIKDWGQSKGAREEYAYVNETNQTINRYCAMEKANDVWFPLYQYTDEILARKGKLIELIFEGDNEDEL